MTSEKKGGNEISMKIIARIQSDFPTKFGIPRQSGLVKELRSAVIFEPEFRNPDAFKGLEEYSHIWLIWEFSESVRDTWSPTVRPPRLGGNVRKGVFATRSPFRPNPIGLSCVELEKIELRTECGPVLYIKGADLMDGTPILDIKPYLPFSESYPEAKGEFPIVKDTTPNMMNPRLYTTSYNKPQGQQFDDTAVLSFIKLQYT